MKRSSSRRSLWWAAGGILLLAAVTLRAIIAARGLEASTGSAAFDAILLGVGITVFILVLVFGGLRLGTFAVARALRRKYEGALVRSVVIRPEDMALLAKLGVEIGLMPRRPLYGAVKFDSDGCSWWIGASRLRKIAEVSSRPMRWSIGKFDHAGFEQTSLLLEVPADRTNRVPVIILRDNGGLLPRRPTDVQLEEFVEQLSAPSPTTESAQ